ncbi:MAG TPA: hypothetical protein DG754_12965 [Bacteroidales bacterium]|nr:hypothetical protein [Bacteroidales bacterium]
MIFTKPDLCAIILKTFFLGLQRYEEITDISSCKVVYISVLFADIYDRDKNRVPFTNLAICG